MGSEEVGAEGSGKRGAGGRQRSGVGEGLTGAGAPEEVQGRKAPVARPAALPPNRPAMKRLWKAAGVAEDRDFKLYFTVIHLNVKYPHVASGCPIQRAALATDNDACHRHTFTLYNWAQSPRGTEGLA